MEFGLLNLTGFIIVVLMLIPNIIFAFRNSGLKNKCTSKPMLVIEQVGRYGSFLLMIFPILVWKFGFVSAEECVIWIALCAAMLLAYLICWIFCFRKTSLGTALWLAILPSAIFILRGVFLRHWLLTVFGFIFAVWHIYITWFNNKPEVESK